MNETKNIKARRSDGTVEECPIQIVQNPKPKLIFSGVGLPEREFSSGDLFDALLLLRKALEEISVQLLCAGARRDVFPSGMSRDMSAGRKAYITKMGLPALRSDMIDIFDYCDAEAVGKISDQLAFHEKWIASFQK